MKEATRLHNTSLLIPRMTTADTTLCGYHIPRHTMVQVNTWAIANDPSLWANAQQFDPSRFLPSSSHSHSHSHTHTHTHAHPVAQPPPDWRGRDVLLNPFGMGRRGCPGASLGVDMLLRVAAAMLRRYDLHLPAGVAAVDMSEKFEISPTMRQPLQVVLSRREAALAGGALSP